jgi:hypothetical protein
VLLQVRAPGARRAWDAARPRGRPQPGLRHPRRAQDALAFAAPAKLSPIRAVGRACCDAWGAVAPLERHVEQSRAVPFARPAKRALAGRGCKGCKGCVCVACANHAFLLFRSRRLPRRASPPAPRRKRTRWRRR